MTNMNQQQDPDGTYVRRKAKLSLGDGPDQRGEITVELVAPPEDLDASFADWRLEVDRGVKVLRDELGLPEGDVDVEGDLL